MFNNNIIEEIKNLMDKQIILFKTNISKIRTNFISPNILNNILVDYYGSKVFLYKLGYVSVKSSDMLFINVFDINSLIFIKKAILSSNLGLNPYISGSVIYIPLPKLTSDRRLNFIKFIQTETENVKISIRNIRRNIKLKIKKFLSNKKIDIDSAYNYYNEIQKITDFFIKKINFISSEKKIELSKN